jgi:predicted helicase
MMSFTTILDKYRKIAFSERDKGDRFERLMQAYLQTDPKYAYRFKHVWLWNEFLGKLDLGGGDTGIDIVALSHEGDGIKNDPNDWATETGQPRYILDLLLSIINVSLLTVDIVEALPEVRFE